MPNEPRPLTGLAIGDALGMPFETHHFTSKALADWDGSFQSGASNSIQPGRKPGEWTDDTKMARALAQSLFQNETYNPLETLGGYLAWYASGDHRGIGKATKEAMDRALRGHHWTSTGVHHAQGNGTAMRVAPLGLYYRKNLVTVIEMARIDARLTHRSLEAEDGSVAVALGVALISEGIADKDRVLEPILAMLPEESVIRQKLLAVRKFAESHAPDDEATPKALFNQLFESGTGAHVLQTVPAAFLCFMCTNSFRDAVETAIRAGGDTDTTAAITGALAGAYYGDEHVAPYLTELEDGDYLQHLDHVLYLTAPNVPDDV